MIMARIIIGDKLCQFSTKQSIFILTFVKGRMPEMLGTNISSTKPFYDKVRLGLLPIVIL